VGAPRTAFAVVALGVLGALFCALGRWQWQRAAESRATAAEFAAGGAAEMLAVAPHDLLDGALRFRRLRIEGEYAPGRQVLLDNMVHDGVAGYQVLTPLRIDSSALLLVNRGWLPAGPDRRVLPDVGVASAQRRVLGRLERLPRPGLRLAAAVPDTAEAIAVLSYPTAADLAALLGGPVLDYQLLLDPDEPDGYTRDWRAPGLAPERHLVYAGQWLLLAAGAAAAAVTIGVRAWRGRQGGRRGA
jgi:surfeit locus 1 family protein